MPAASPHQFESDSCHIQQGARQSPHTLPAHQGEGWGRLMRTSLRSKMTAGALHGRCAFHISKLRNNCPLVLSFKLPPPFKTFDMTFALLDVKTVYYPQEVSRGKYWGWEYSCCNTSLLSMYENRCITIQRDLCS